MSTPQQKTRQLERPAKPETVPIKVLRQPTATPPMKRVAASDLAALAGRMNETHTRMIRTTLELVRHIGLDLIAAKRHLGHGRFLPWVEQHCRFGARSARAYLQVAEGWDQLEAMLTANRQSAADLTLTGATRYLASQGKVHRQDSVVGADLPTFPEFNLKAVSGPVVSEASEASASRDSDKLDHRPRRTNAAMTSVARLTIAVDHPVKPDQEDQTPPAASYASSKTTSDAVGPTPTAATATAVDSFKSRQWLDSLPTRRFLADPTIFDREALEYRRVEPVIRQLEQIGGYSPRDLRYGARPHDVRKRVRSIVASLTGTLPPERWPVCPECGGSGKHLASPARCRTCHSAGFLIPHSHAETPLL